MKTIFTVIAIGALTATLSAYAADEHHPEEQKAAPSKTAPANKPQEKSAATSPKSAQGSSSQGSGMPAGMMDNMNKMQEQMQQIMRTQDPTERERLLKDHMQAMQQQMKMMSGMMGRGMMMGGDKPVNRMPPEKRMQMMEQRMDMMQKMMEQMLQQMQVTQPK